MSKNERLQSQSEAERLLWNFISAARALAEADSGDVAPSAGAMKQAEDAISELGYFLTYAMHSALKK